MRLEPRVPSNRPGAVRRRSTRRRQPSWRPSAELEALIAGAKPVCRIVVTIHRRDTVCSPPPALTAELGRAKRRSELERKIETARLELAAPATRQANSDAVAIAAYLSALGWAVEADTLNRLLALLAVLVIELGGGASLAIGMALSEASVRHQQTERTKETNDQTERTVTANERQITSPECQRENAGPFSAIDRSPALNERPVRVAHERVLGSAAGEGRRSSRQSGCAGGIVRVVENADERSVARTKGGRQGAVVYGKTGDGCAIGRLFSTPRCESRLIKQRPCHCPPGPIN